MSTRHLHIDLKTRAHLEMVRGQFVPDFEPDVIEELKHLAARLPKSESDIRDLRHLLWSSIDNNDSLDLDQIEYCKKNEDDSIRLFVAIADVDLLVPKDSACDRHALANGTSVYTGIVTYPMLPDQLSTNLSSLKQGSDRRAVVIEMTIGPGGEVDSAKVYLAMVRNHAKLAYDDVGKWLESGEDLPVSISLVPSLAEQLQLQNEARQRLHALRKERGALRLETIEARAITEDGQVIDLALTEHNPARDLIENFMIAANIAISNFLEAANVPSIRRVVRTPQRWDRIVDVARQQGESLPPEPDVQALASFLIERRDADPLHFPDLSLTIVKLLGPGEYTVHTPGHKDEGHFALAVHDYTHATAPNRRYADLATQRLVKAVLLQADSPYALDELAEIARRCTDREDESKRVERTMRKIAAAVLLGKRIGETFDGIVTGVTDGGTFVRLLKPPAEGRVVQGEHGLDVGDKVRLRLLSTDPDNAWIDFARVRHT